MYLARLKELRECNNLSQTEMAKLLCMTRQSYNHYELGKREANYETLIKIANCFHVSLDYLFDLEPLANSPVGQYSPDELSLIKKYRTLDEYGKQRILNAIKLEFEQITAQTTKQ